MRENLESKIMASSRLESPSFLLMYICIAHRVVRKRLIASLRDTDVRENSIYPMGRKIKKGLRSTALSNGKK